jgi:S-adenosylmethionine uptake transporter
MPVVQSNLRGAMLSLAAFALYATHDVVVKFLGVNYSAFQIIFFSGLMGFPLITIMLLTDRSDGNLIPKHGWWTLLRTVVSVLTGIGAFYAFSKLPLAQCYAIFFAMPILITLMAIPILGEKIGARRGAAIVVGLVGVLIVLRPGQIDLQLGHIAALAAAICGATSSVIVRKIGHDERSAVLMLYPMVASVFTMGLAMPFVYVPMPLAHLGLLAVMAALGLGGAALVIAAYRAAPAIIVAPMQYSQIIWAAVFGHFVFGEEIDSYTGAGTAVIIASGIYIVLREGTPRVSENRPVLGTRSRLDTGTVPRISTWLRLFERRQRPHTDAPE